MSWLSTLIVKLRALFRRDAVAGEIHDELAFHLEMRIEEYERRGLSRREARSQAMKRFGNPSVHQDRGYDVRGGGVIETILQDVRYAVRLLRKQPGFAATAIITLALGIGVSTALFSVIDAALLHPLPFPHPEQLYETTIFTPAPVSGGRSREVGPSLNDARDWRAHGAVLGAAVMRTPWKRVVDAGAGPERLDVGEMSDGFLGVCGVAPVLGRDLAADDVKPGAAPVVLLGFGYWQSRFGGDPGVIGRTVRFLENQGAAGGVSATVVGVLPKEFYSRVTIWRATVLQLPFVGPDRRGTGAATIVRLRPGTDLTAAAREMSRLSTHSFSVGDRGAADQVRMVPLVGETTRGYATTISTLSWAVGLIVLLACVNVAGLLLARGATRAPEFAIRASIGAGRARLIRQLLTESLVLALAGGVLGALAAWVSLEALVSIVPLRLPATSVPAIGLPVLAFAFALSLVTSIVFGLIPAFKVSRVNIASGVGGRGSARAGLSGRTGQTLIGLEVAIAIVLVAAAGLMIKSFAAATAVDVGFDPSSIIVMDAAPIDQKAGVLSQYYPALVERVRAMPGVAAASAAVSMPMSGSFSMGFFQAEGGASASATSRVVFPGYTRVLGLTVSQGAEPSAADLAAGRKMVMLNERAAADWFHGASPVGAILKTFCAGGKSCEAQVTGVVNDTKQDGPMYEPSREVLEFSNGSVSQAMMVIIRPENGARVSTEALRRAATSSGPEAFVDRIRSGSELLAERVLTPRQRTLLFGLLGALGLMLTLVGVFGVTAYAVTRRTPEMAVRLAFGAEPRQIVRRIVVSSAWPAAIGTVAGLGGAYVSTRTIAKFLFHVSPTDPATFAIVCIGVAAAAGLAAWLPARRTANVDPVKVLREVQ
jgi:predicted permease